MVYCVLVCCIMAADDCSLSSLSVIAEKSDDVGNDVLPSSHRIFSRCNECIIPRRFLLLLSCIFLLLVDSGLNGVVIIGNDDCILLLLTKVMSVPIMNAEVIPIRRMHRPKNNNIMAEERLLVLLKADNIDITSHALRRQPIISLSNCGFSISLPTSVLDNKYDTIICF